VGKNRCKKRAKQNIADVTARMQITVAGVHLKISSLVQVWHFSTTL
jgi:hypothetical protein